MTRKGLVFAFLLTLALPAWGQYVGGGGGSVTSPVATDPLSFTGAVTFDNAANTPLVCSDGLSAPAAAAGVDGADLYLYATDGNPSTSDQNGGSIVLLAGSGISDQAGDADGGGIQLNPGAGTGAGVAGEVTVAANRNFCVGGGSGSASGICIGSSAITGEGSSADGFETILAFGDATADQTLTCTGAASSLGCVVASPAVPTNGATAGNSLALTASPAIPNAGAGTDGAAAGGSITLTAGAAARDTSGNANGGDILLVTPGNGGVGTGRRGYIGFQPNNSLAAFVGVDAATEYAMFLSTGTSLKWGNVGTITADTTLARVSAGSLSVNAGTGTGRVTLGGVLCKGAPAQATTGTSEEVLATCTIPANTLTADGRYLIVRMTGITAANANNKTVRIRVGGIGGTVVLVAGPLAWNNQVWAGNQRIIRLSATAAQAEPNNAASVVYGAKGGTTAVYGANYLLDTGAVTWANANDLVITATTPTAAGDLTLQTYSVEVVQ